MADTGTNTGSLSTPTTEDTSSGVSEDDSGESALLKAEDEIASPPTEEPDEGSVATSTPKDAGKTIDATIAEDRPNPGDSITEATTGPLVPGACSCLWLGFCQLSLPPHH